MFAMWQLITAPDRKFAFAPAKTWCALFRNFSAHPSYRHASTITRGNSSHARDCHAWMWTATRYASFAVARETIQRHPRFKYEQLKLLFESPRAAAETWPTGRHPHFGRNPQTSQVLGASFLERAWTMIFGCTQQAGDSNCSFSADTIADEPHWAQCRSRVSVLVQQEGIARGCYSINNLDWGHGLGGGTVKHSLKVDNKTDAFESGLFLQRHRS